MAGNDLPVATRRQWLAGALALLPAGLARGQSTAQIEPPAAIDLSELCTPAKDQGDRNTCAFFAVVAAAEAILKRDFGRSDALSEEWLIYQWQKSLPNWALDETAEISRVVSLARDIGLVPESAWPYQPTRFAPGSVCAGQAPSLYACGTPAAAPKEPAAECLVQHAPPASLNATAARLRLGKATFRTGAYDRNPTDRICQRLGILKTPQIVALKLPDCHEGWGDDGLVRCIPKILALSQEDREKIPNHFVLLTGYDMASQMFTFKCSWGKGWGRNGYGRICFDDMAQIMRESPLFQIAGLVVT